MHQTLPLLVSAGISPLSPLEGSRKLMFSTQLKDVKFIRIRAADVPTYVKLGAADIGIAGKDVLLEHGTEGLYSPLDLEISRCRLMTAGVIGVKNYSDRRLVATKFVNITRRYYAMHGIQAEVIKLHGAMELAPLMNIADEIVDIVDTGKTLRANCMEQRELIANISTMLVVNHVHHVRILKLIDNLRQAVWSRR